jgi:hypothetical protein
MSLDDESIITQPELRYQVQSNTIIWANFFELTIFIIVQSNVYSVTVIQ